MKPERDPISRDLHTYVLFSTVSLAAYVVVLCIGGSMLLKHAAKERHNISDHGCYVWKDGHVQCTRHYPAMDLD